MTRQSKKLWGGRFGGKKQDPLFERFSSSLRWDIRLLPYELKVDRAHVRALRGCRVLTAGEEKKLLAALADLEKEFFSGRLRPGAGFEDVHSAVHEAVTKKVGALAQKLHTGRSRNELVGQSARLYCLDHGDRLFGLMVGLQKEWLRLAERNQEVYVAGRTHWEKAQVLSAAHIFLAYVEMLERAKKILLFAKDTSDVCVLGSGALAGSNFPLDQRRMARELGLGAGASNSYDAAGDRDFIASFLYALSVLGIQLSRIAEDLMMDKLASHSVYEMDPAFCTGSSMMPQKKNPDTVELSRGMAAVLTANLSGILALLKGLATSYNRDLQWDKRFLFDSVEAAEQLLGVFGRMVAAIRVVKERAAQQVNPDEFQSAFLYATDVADYLVRKGVSFAQAHEQVGRIVGFSEERKVPLSKIGLDLLRRFAPKLEGDVYEIFSAEHSVRLKKTTGSTNPAQVKKQLLHWKKVLG